jgi:hypothetical protein
VSNVSVERERRVRQFEHYLGLMEHRALHLVKSECFVIFSAPAPREIRRRIANSTTRIVQFAFLADGFYLDLPDSTLTPEESRVAVQRPGFGFALDNPQIRPDERQHDPIQRRYQYSEHRTAAEDAAFVFFDLWRMPLDVWFKVHAAAFEGSRKWERGFSMG